MDVVNGALGDEQGLGQFVGDVHALETSVYRLMELLDRVGDYVRDVLTKSTKENMVLGRALLSVVTHVPKIDTADFSKAFNSHLQDLLMVMYLAEVTKSQLAITESMQLLV
jgi:translation initiation factor 3 subunit F